SLSRREEKNQYLPTTKTVSAGPFDPGGEVTQPTSTSDLLLPIIHVEVGPYAQPALLRQDTWVFRIKDRTIVINQLNRSETIVGIPSMNISGYLRILGTEHDDRAFRNIGDIYVLDGLSRAARVLREGRNWQNQDSQDNKYSHPFNHIFSPPNQ